MRIADPVRRGLNLGLFYEQTQQMDQAAAQWRSVLDATASRHAGAPDLMSRPSRPVRDRWRRAICSIWPVARRTGRWPRRSPSSPNATTWTIATAISSRRGWPLPGRSTTPR